MAQTEDRAVALVIGRLVAALRDQRGWHQAYLAQRIQVAQSSLSRIERGEVAPDIVTFRRLASAFDLTTEEFARQAELAITETSVTVRRNVPNRGGEEWWAAAGAIGLTALIAVAISALVSNKK